MKAKPVAFLLAMLVAGADASSVAADEQADERKIVGKWEVLESQEPLLNEATVEFTKPGTLILTLKLAGHQLPVVANYVLSGDALKVTTKGLDGKQQTDIHKVERLRSRELVIKDDKGKLTTYKKSK